MVPPPLTLTFVTPKLVRAFNPAKMKIPLDTPWPMEGAPWEKRAWDMAETWAICWSPYSSQVPLHS